MSTINAVINDLKLRLQAEMDESEWYMRQFKIREENIQNLKHTIHEMESLVHG